jgi:hypothetical protein
VSEKDGIGKNDSDYTECSHTAGDDWGTGTVMELPFVSGNGLDAKVYYEIHRV